MTFDQFNASLSEPLPPQTLSNVQLALWYDGKKDWTKAHGFAQEVTTEAGSWVHAYLHRKEGDAGNAAYWYSRAGKKMPSYSLEQEWEELVKALLF